MATYLIDFENVGSDGLCGTEELTEKDSVYIFYSSNSGRISMKMHQCICCCKANFRYFEISVGGKNALDFQLSTFLGYLISLKDTEEIFIISKDRGFRHILNFWTERAEQLSVSGFSLVQKTSINAESALEDISAQHEPNEQNNDGEDNQLSPENTEPSESDRIRTLIQNLDDVSSHTVLYKKLVYKLGHEKGAELYRKLGVTTALSKQEFHRRMVAEYGQANGSAIYNKLKKLVKK